MTKSASQNDKANGQSGGLSQSALPGLKARYSAEKRFQNIGIAAIVASLAFLAFLLVSIGYKGHGAFFSAQVQISVEKTWLEDTGYFKGEGDSFSLIRKAVVENLPEVNGRSARRDAYGLVGVDAESQLNTWATENHALMGERAAIWLQASDDVDSWIKAGQEPGSAKLSDRQIAWLQTLDVNGQIKTSFNFGFLTNGDSRDPERAGVGGALMGSIFTLIVCLLLSFGIGVMAAIYLEEFAPQNRWTSFLEVNINNLASVPSIIYGLLGLAVLLGVFGMPRSSALAGGTVLALMTLPTIIIAARVSLKSVPPSIREAAFGLGASRVESVFHHVVPLALPGMLTGTILGMARALGETAPLLMIGMVAFIADVPSSFLDPASALPVQVYLWADSPERAFAEKTAGAIIVLLVFLVLMNLAAILLRRKFERRW